MGNHIILGYDQILFREIKLDDFPDEISEYNADVKEDKISAWLNGMKSRVLKE